MCNVCMYECICISFPRVQGSKRESMRIMKSRKVSRFKGGKESSKNQFAIFLRISWRGEGRLFIARAVLERTRAAASVSASGIVGLSFTPKIGLATSSPSGPATVQAVDALAAPPPLVVAIVALLFTTPSCQKNSVGIYFYFGL